MEIDDFQKFHDGISGVMSFYGKSVSRFALDVWWTALRRFDLVAIVDAFNRHLANPDTGQFAPKPADIIRMLQGSTQDSALRAWAKVDHAVRSVGTYCDVVFDDALIHRVIRRHDHRPILRDPRRRKPGWSVGLAKNLFRKNIGVGADR